ncbi:amino acid permease-domain-containing protein, partial [Gymnopilus junonius]
VVEKTRTTISSVSKDEYGSGDSASAENGFWGQRACRVGISMMIAIGGTIGTGIFLSAGCSLAGPGSALLSYFVVDYSGEMSSMYPVSGAFSIFGARFVSPALGFTLGWNYCCNGNSPMSFGDRFPNYRVNSGCCILQFWTDRLQPWHWAIIIIVPVFALQLIHVRVYGSLMIVLFIIVGLIFDWGGVKGHPGPVRLSNFHNGQAFIGGFASIVAVAAGESAKPYKAVPRAIKATFFRIILFYILTILTIGLCINNSDPTLLSAAFDSDVTASPVTVVLCELVWCSCSCCECRAPTAVLSATNSCFYASSRMLLSLARSGHAPRVFGWVNSRGVPVLPCCIVFTWLLNITGISALLVQAYKAHGLLLSDLPVSSAFLSRTANRVITLRYTLYEKFILKQKYHFVPTAGIDFVTDAVWSPGEGAMIREQDLRDVKKSFVRKSTGFGEGKAWIKRHIY